MDIYRLERPLAAPWDAVAYNLGTWIPAVPGGRCPECYATNKGTGPPLILGWDKVPEKMPDFVWPLDPGGVLAVTQRAREALEQAGISGIEFSPVVATTEPTRRIGAAPREYVPYTGPPLWLLHPTSIYLPDRERSNVKFSWRCSTCGGGHYDVPIGRDVRYIVLDQLSWRGEGIFRIDPYIGSFFCTEPVKTLIEDHQFGQCEFLLEGEILPPGVAPTRPVSPPTMKVSRFDMRPRSGGPTPTPRPPLSIPRDAVLQEYSAIAQLQVGFPRLQPDSPETCPVGWDSIIEYLAMEIPDESINPSDLTFVRTAQVGNVRYWLWSFVDIYAQPAYLLVSEDADGITAELYDETHGLSPEQFMLVDYYSWR